MNHSPTQCKICGKYHCLAGCVPIEECEVKALKQKHDKQGYLSQSDYMRLTVLENYLALKETK